MADSQQTDSSRNDDAQELRKEPPWIVRWFWVGVKLLSRRIDHEDVVEHVREEGQLSGRYLFMIVMSCAIATLGLLLSSPAVIIGAMLISPLMGPIMLMGFSLSTLDLVALRRSVFSMACGVLGALAISILIVKLSPLTDPTPEILARTRPNFFDLLVAVFSGLAGGYAVINRKGETIVGVAIATALMPPLAVTGYGLAVAEPAVAGGAFFLFMTNLLAIALTVTLMSRLYGFGKGHGRSTTVWQSVLILLVFAGLSAPLGLALRDIAYETTVNNVVKANVLTPFQGKRARAGDVFVSFPRDAPINVEVTVLTRERVPGAEAQLQDVLSRKLSGNVQVAMDQVLVNEDRDVERAQMIKLAESSLTAPLRAEVNELKVIAERQRTEAEVRNAAAFPLAAADIDAQAQTAHFFGAQSPDFPVSAWRVSEEGLGRNFPAWQMTVTPPVVEMPLIPFAEGADDLDAGALKIINDCQWALERWNVEAVEVVGYASTAGAVQRFNNQALAYRRAEAVASILRENGIAATPVGEYRAFNQDQEERVLGRQRFQSVLIRPSSP
ncbi:MAG: hypothetical protein CME89_04205 [Hirschia sp.]|nr:hypothetical protein [Hirschia sp.]